MFVSQLIEKYRWNSGIAVEESISQAAGLRYRGGLRFFVCSSFILFFDDDDNLELTTYSNRG